MGARKLPNHSDFKQLYPSVENAHLQALMDKRIEAEGVQPLDPEEEEKLKEWINDAKRRGHPRSLAIAILSEEIGHGVFLKRRQKRIPPGTYIAVYGGVNELVYDLGDATSEEDAYSFQISPQAFQVDSWTARYCKLDDFDPESEECYCVITCNASEKGNWTRFINHGSGSSANLSLVRIAMVHPKTKRNMIMMAFRTQKTIHPGEQLLWDYGKSFWKSEERKAFYTPCTAKTYQIGADGNVFKQAQPVKLKKRKKTSC